MNHIVLVFLLVLFLGNDLFAQNTRAREIVNRALEKHTSGKKLDQYAVKLEYEKPGKTPVELNQPNQVHMLLDSVMKTRPDSVRNAFELVKTKSEQEIFQMLVNSQTNNRHWLYVNLTIPKMASIHVQPNRLKGTTDSTRAVFDQKTIEVYGGNLNPIAILQLMLEGSTQLNYIGTSFLGGQELHIIQTRWRSKWIDVYFDKETFVVTQLIERETDMDPLMGRGPKYYKNIVVYRQYMLIDGFLLPVSVEEIMTSFPFTTRKKLTWISINKVLPVALFSPVLSDEELIKFSFADIGGGLRVMEQSGRYQNRRSLIRIKQNTHLDLFTDLSNDEVQTNKMLEAMGRNFPALGLDNVFNLHNLHGIVSQTGLFAKGARLFAPKDVQQTRRVHNGRFETDSLWSRVLDSGSLVNFDIEFQKDNVRILIVNPDINPTDLTGYITGYYLPESRIVYFSGNPYAANEIKRASLNEKWLYDVIKSKNMNVKRIVYSEAFIDNVPLFMSFEDFEKRILNTDFSEYEK